MNCLNKCTENKKCGLSSALFLFFFAAHFHPCLFHILGVGFHDRAFAQDAPSTAKIFQDLKKEIDLQIRFAQRQMIFSPLGPYSIPDKWIWSFFSAFFPNAF